MKAIYTIIGQKVYQIEQDVSAPIRDVKVLNKNIVNLSTDTTQKTVTAVMYFTDWSNVGIKSNKEKACELINYLKDKVITQVDKIQSLFTVSIDYSLCNSEGKEIEHSVVIKPMQFSDFIYPLGVNEENECVYRRFKRLTANIDWIITNKLPYGIICTKNQKTIININSIDIYIDRFANEDVNNHPSIYGQSYNCKSCTVNTSLKNKLLIYSTSEEGYEISPIVNEFNPRTIELNLTIDLTNFTVIYNNANIDKILADNVRIVSGDTSSGNDDENNDDNGCHCGCGNCHNNNSGNTPDPDPDPGSSNSENTNVDPDPSSSSDNNPDPDPEPDSSGSGSNNNNSSSDPIYTYTRSTVSNSYALLVVSDTYPSDLFDENTMVHKSDVLPVIADIEINEYVLRSEIIVP